MTVENPEVDAAGGGKAAGAVRKPPALPTWLIATVSGAFGLLYAYVVWNAITLLVIQANGPLGLNGLGWALLAGAALFPVLIFAICFAVAWRRRLGVLALVLLTGLAVVAVFWLDVVGYAYTNGATLLGG